MPAMLQEVEDFNEKPLEKDRDTLIIELINSLPEDKQITALEYLRRMHKKQ